MGFITNRIRILALLVLIGTLRGSSVPRFSRPVVAPTRDAMARMTTIPDEHASSHRQQQADKHLLHDLPHRQREAGLPVEQQLEPQLCDHRSGDERQQAGGHRQRHRQREVGAPEQAEVVGGHRLRRGGRQDQPAGDGRLGAQHDDQPSCEQRQQKHLPGQGGRDLRRVVQDPLQIGRRQLEADDRHRHDDQHRQSRFDDDAHAGKV